MKLRPVWKLLLLFVAVNVLLLGWNLTQLHGDGLLHVTFLDVGQGDACVILVTVSNTVHVQVGAG